MTTKGGQKQFPGKRATIFLRSDDVATHCMFLCGYYSRAAFRKPADINNGWIRYTRAIQRRLLDTGSSTMQPLSSAVNHGNELYTTNIPSASLVTIIRIHVPRVAMATIRGRGEIRYHHHYGVCKTIVVAAAATVYQELHF